MKVETQIIDVLATTLWDRRLPVLFSGSRPSDFEYTGIDRLGVRSNGPRTSPTIKKKSAADSETAALFVRKNLGGPYQRKSRVEL